MTRGKERINTKRRTQESDDEWNVEVSWPIGKTNPETECVFDWFYGDEVRNLTETINLETQLEYEFDDPRFSNWESLNQKFNMRRLNTTDKTIKVLENSSLNWNGSLIIDGIHQTDQAKKLLFSLLELDKINTLPEAIKIDIIEHRLEEIENIFTDYIDKYKDYIDQNVNNLNWDEERVWLYDQAQDLDSTLRTCFRTSWWLEVIRKIRDINNQGLLDKLQEMLSRNNTNVKDHFIEKLIEKWFNEELIRGLFQ